jgi:hypothetical protein
MNPEKLTVPLLLKNPSHHTMRTVSPWAPPPSARPSR